MLNEDPNLPFLGMAWSQSGMSEFFNRQVLPTLCPGQAVFTGVAIEDMTYFAGRKCDILYSLQRGHRPVGESVLAVVTFTRDSRAERIYTRHYGAGVNSSVTATPSRAAYFPEYRCLVELFPADWGLPSLSRAVDGDNMASLLGQLGPYPENRSACRPKVDVLRYRPRLRCVIRYGWCSDQGQDSMRVVGKVYPPGPKAGQAWHALNTLHAQAMAGVIIPRPLRLVEDWNLVLMEYVPGRSMKQVLEGATARRHAEEVLQAAARTLAWIHSRNLVSEEVWSWETQLAHLRLLNTSIHLVAPDLATKVHALLDHIAPLMQGLSVGTASCIHGDCKPSQFLMNEGQVALVDFDRACLGDPAVDIGNFIAALHKEAVRGQEYGRELASFFLAEYERCSGRDLVDRVRLFRAASLVRMAVRSFKRSPYRYARNGCDSLPVRLLQEATTCLAGL